MILCVNETGALKICACHVKEAIERCMELIPNYQSFVMAGGKSTTSEVGAQLIEDIWTSRSRSITKQEFLTRHFHQFDLDVIDKCIDTLGQAGLIQSTLDVRNNAVEIRITGKCKDRFGLKEDANK